MILKESLKIENSTDKEKRVEFPESWNIYGKTWIKKEDFKDKNGTEITDIDGKINKFVDLLNNLEVSNFEGGITNFCFRFPDIVKDIFGAKRDILVIKDAFFSKTTTKSTNPFNYPKFCDAIFNFIDKNSGSQDAKKQNYCLLMDKIFFDRFVGYDDAVEYNKTKDLIQGRIGDIFDENKWTHMPMVNLTFMEELCKRIDSKDIEKYSVKFVLGSKSKNKKDANKFDREEISKYGSIIIDANYTDEENSEKDDKPKIENLNKLKLSYYKALLKNKLDANQSDKFFNNISFIDFSEEKRQKNKFTNIIFLCTNKNQLENKDIQSKLVSLPKEIIESSLSAKDKSNLLQNLYDEALKLTEQHSKICLNMAQATMNNLSQLINATGIIDNDISYLSDALKSVCNFAVLKNRSDDTYTKVSQAFISVVPLINTSNFNYLLELLRDDIEKNPNNTYLNAINEAAKKLATAQKINQATHKLQCLLDLVKCEEKKDENKNVEIVNKNINSDIFQSLFNAIDECYPLLDNENKFNRDNFSKRNELRNTLFENFLKVDKNLRNAQNAYLSIAEKIMKQDQDTRNKINDGNSACSELQFLIRVIIGGRKKFSVNSNKSIVLPEDIKKLIETIEQCFPSSNKDDKEANNNNRYKLIKYLFESLEGQNIDSDVFMLLFDEINKEFPLLSKDKSNTILPELKAEELKKRNELLGKLSNISVIANSKKNKTAQGQYFDTVNQMINAYKSNFLRENTVNTVIDKDRNKNGNEDGRKKLILESLIRMTILGQVNLSPEPTKSKVKYKDIIELIDIIEKSFRLDSENDKNNRYDLIKCLFDQFHIIKDFLLPCNKILDAIIEFAKNNFGQAFVLGINWIEKAITNKKKITDFFSPSKESEEKTEETKDMISDVENTQEKSKNTPEKEKNKKAGNKILSYKEILPSQINNAVNNYNKKLEKDQVNEKFDLDTQILNDIKRHNVMKKISKLNKIINNNSPDLKNPVIGIFEFLYNKKFNLDKFLSTFQNNYLNAVVDLINIGSKVLDQFITKQDVTKETGEIFKKDKNNNKNKNNNDKFNQTLVYNGKLKHVNELIISNFIQQGIKKVVENLDKFFGKSFKNEKDKDENLIEDENLINEKRRCNISQDKIDAVSQKITSSLLKKFGSVYGLISKIQTVAQNIGKNGEYNTTASAIFDFVLDCINDENDKDSNLLLLLLELVGVFDFGNFNIEKDSVQSKKIIYSVINSFMGLITLSKALDCDTEIFANDKNINNKKKTTDKLINLLKKIVDTKEFKGFVRKFLSDEYIEKIKQLLDDVDKLKFEDCTYLLCSDEILAQNKENQREDEKVKEEKNQNMINTINIINEEDDKNDLLDNKNLIKEKNEKESKLDIILNQTAMFVWLRKNTNDKTVFFALTKSLSDENKIKEFDKYKKEQIKNDQDKRKKIKNINVNNNASEKKKIDLNVNKIKNDLNLNNKKQLENDITKKNQIEKNLNSNELKDEINNGKDNINKINIDTNIQGNEFDKNKHEKMMQNEIIVIKKRKPTKIKFVLDEESGDKKENGQNKVETNTMKHKHIEGNQMNKNDDIGGNGEKANKFTTEKVEINNGNLFEKGINGKQGNAKQSENKIGEDNNNIDNKQKQNNVEKKQKKIFDSTRLIVELSRQNKGINNKEITERRGSFTFKNEYLLDERNGNKTGNQIKINDKNNKGNKNNGVRDKISELKKEENIKDKTKNTNSNVGGNVEATENNFHANLTNIKEIDIKNDIIIEEVEEEDKKENKEENKNNVKDINENNNIVNPEGHKEEKDKNIEKKTEINLSLIKDQFNKGKGEGIENGKIIGAVEIKEKINENKKDINIIGHDTKNKGINNKKNKEDEIKRSRSFILSFHLPNQIKNNNSTILANQIQTTKSNQKNKIIAAIIFGIISVLSGVVLVIVLLEALKFLAIIITFVLAVTLITTIVFIFSIFRDNKVSEPKTIQENLELKNNLDISKNNKNVRISRKIIRSRSVDSLSLSDVDVHSKDMPKDTNEI